MAARGSESLSVVTRTRYATCFVGRPTLVGLHFSKLCSAHRWSSSLGTAFTLRTLRALRARGSARKWDIRLRARKSRVPAYLRSSPLHVTWLISYLAKLAIQASSGSRVTQVCSLGPALSSYCSAFGARHRIHLVFESSVRVEYIENTNPGLDSAFGDGSCARQILGCNASSHE